MTDNDDKQAGNHFADIRPDEREKLTKCRRDAITAGFVTSGISWLLTRYLLTSTPLKNTSLARHSGLIYTFVVGFALYQGVLESGKSCLKSLATLENSRYGEFARRAITMHEDKKKLSRVEFLQKYPPDEQRKLLDPTQILTFDSGDNVSLSTPAQSPEESAQSDDMFKTQKPEPPYKPKSFQDFQKENRAKSTYPSFRDYNTPNVQESNNKPPAKRPDTDGNLPPGPEDKSKVKRNKYGDVIYEE